WLGKLFIMQSVPLILLMAFFHILIAINRVSALINPTTHMQFWSEGRINRIIIVFWVVTMLECLPLVYPFEGAYCIRISPVRTEGVALVIVGELPNLIYQGIAVAIGGLFEIITIVLYVFVGCRVNKLKKLSRTSISTTISAVLISTGGFVIIIVVLPHLILGRINGEGLWSAEIFYATFKFASAYNNAVAPWVMLFQHRNIRRILIGVRRDIPPTARRVTLNAELKQNRSL
ncbi:hypothetical protein PMAYCL1PPCAC_05198, partial [Pristionchus mayeri]